MVISTLDRDGATAPHYVYDLKARWTTSCCSLLAEHDVDDAVDISDVDAAVTTEIGHGSGLSLAQHDVNHSIDIADVNTAIAINIALETLARAALLTGVINGEVVDIDRNRLTARVLNDTNLNGLLVGHRDKPVAGSACRGWYRGVGTSHDILSLSPSRTLVE